MNKEELIGKLHMIYAGDRNALEEMVGYYDGLKECIEIVQQENKELKEKLALHRGALKREHEAIHRANDLEEVIDKAIELLGNYKHYSTPDEKQNGDNEDLINNAFDTLKEVSK